MPGWVTVFGRVNHLGAEPGSQAYSAWACPLWLGWYEYPAKAGGVKWHIAYTLARIRGLVVFAECLAGGLACRDQRRLTGSSSALEALRDDALYKYTFTLLTLLSVSYWPNLCCHLVNVFTVCRFCQIYMPLLLLLGELGRVRQLTGLINLSIGPAYVRPVNCWATFIVIQ